MSGSGVCAASALRTVQRPLWDMIAEALRPAERDIVRRVIGESLLAENQMLFDEANALSDILGEVRVQVRLASASSDSPTVYPDPKCP